PNAELRCMAFIGMVASYILLQDRTELIEEKMIEAVAADAATAEQWLGRDLVREIRARLPALTIACPQCGRQNPAGSKFCNHDGYPLGPRQKPVVSQSVSPGSAHAKPGSWNAWKPCPRCGTTLPAIRVPKNMQQFLWGGVTCETCGTELDRHGRPRNG